MSVMYLRGEDGKFVPVRTIKGNKGDKGDKGDPGSPGQPGKTPVKDTDYFTADDKAEMVTAVKAALPSETWTFTLSDGSTVTKKVVLA